MNNEVGKIIKAIAEDVSKDINSAREYLQEEMPLYGNTRDDLLLKLRNFISNQRLIQGKASQEKLQDRLRQFIEKVKGLSLEEILGKYPAIPRTAFSKLEGQKLDDAEMEELLKDSAVLGFLEAQENNEFDDKQI